MTTLAPGEKGQVDFKRKINIAEGNKLVQVSPKLKIQLTQRMTSPVIFPGHGESLMSK